MRIKIVVLGGYCLNPGGLTWKGLEGLGEVTVYDRTPPELAELGALRYIGVLATGERGEVVTNVLLLELCHHVGMQNSTVRAGEWTASADWSFWRSPQVELAGKTLGCIEHGRTGAQTGRIGEAMGMRVVVNLRSGGMALEKLLEQSDVVSLHCPLFPETQGMICASTLLRMKPSAFLLNTSRGPLVVDQDLADALNAGIIAGAGVDVLSLEPPAGGSPLFSAVENIASFAGRSPRNVITR